MSYSSHVTSVLPIENDLTSTSLPLTFTLPAGTLTRSNLTVVFGIVSETVGGFSWAKVAAADRPSDATTAVRSDTFKRFTMVPTRVLSTTVMNLPARGPIVALLGLLAALAGCQRGQPAAGHDVGSPRPVATTAPAAQLSRFEYSKIYMGMRTRLVVYAIDETAAVNACRAAFDRVGQVDDAASDYRRDSELMKLCAAAATRPVRLSDDLFTLLTEAQRLAELSDGAFDATVGPYVQLWRRARKEKKLPTPEEIAEAV